MANDESEQNFWQKPAPVNQQAEQQKKSVELGDEDMGTMKIRVPKPLFSTPTKCKITEVKFFKLEEKEQDKNGKDFLGFFATLTFQEQGGKEAEFKESYRGGRVYERTAAEGGGTSIYIGPDSQLGKLKAVCIDNKVDIGQNVQQWAAGMTGRVCMMKMDIVMFGGKKYEKNFVLSFLPQ